MRLVMMLFVGVIFLISCTSRSILPEESCTSAADCVPAECCHAKTAANSAYAPDCSDLLCTADCVPETLDCGQGEIECVNNRCIVKINNKINN